MTRRGLLIIIIFLVFIVLGSEASDDQKYYCNNITNPSPCRNLLNINYPFRLSGDPPNCGGNPRYNLLRMRVVDSGLQIHNCSSLPLHPLTSYVNFTSPYYPHDGRDPYYYLPHVFCEGSLYNFLECTGLVYHRRTHTVPIHPLEYEAAGHYPSFSEIHLQLAMGFELSWFPIDCESCDQTWGRCYHEYDHFNNSIGPFMLLRTSVGIICFCTLLIYMLRRRHFSMDTNIEEFLQEQNNLMLVKYSYSEIKKMTKHFSDKLGQGGFGSVYKGKLRSGNLVAIKMLAKSKEKFQTLIHPPPLSVISSSSINVVQLIGFCFEKSKKALVYDFMPNGSLDKFIFTQEQTEISLNWKNMFKIALGIVQGIKNLHRGCDMQILHFDIKPHNVLLDEDFTPKISDFGLAKLYLTIDDIVSFTAARGTIGYIASELVYKSMGGVSHKADVYSFGMLLMEMAGRRKNVNPCAKTTSQVYFPSWIYEKLSRGEDTKMEDATEEDKSIVRKMIIVALSCIQLKPNDRPSMSRVIEMLESPTELLQIPPRPFLGSSLERMEEDQTIIALSSTSLQPSSWSNYSTIRSN
ncbi:hypothetical protein NE237_013979 [Protea cynaroides]|uniref:Protein kinase domain-containing protein n=1 Tax=Protea cynaroides TaxID=273540 RepID=A0A9Q0JZ31_9MAGN|nr:hypothetical protein NE237_013979 [Protea cynaroides]